MPSCIEIRGARVHNLKNFDLDLPKNKLIVITGVSGSGKSSLAFDTLYAEGQRRYVESLSAYARQFLERMDRPDVDEIRGISPAVAIEQKNQTKSSRSTVATVTEIHDYIRLLFARIGRTICPNCNLEIKADQVDDAVDRVLTLPPESKIQIVFPMPVSSAEELDTRIAELREAGFYRLLLDGVLFDAPKLTKDTLASAKKIQILVDRLKVRSGEKTRLADSLDLAFRAGDGRVEVLAEGRETLAFSQSFECANCGSQFIPPQPRLFSFNNPFGACVTCRGFGEIIELDLNLVIPDHAKTLAGGAIAPWNTPKRRNMRAKLAETARRHDIDMDCPWRDLAEAHKAIIIDGNRDFPGVRGFFRKMERKKYRIGVRVMLSRYRGFVACPECKMTRLRPEALNVKIASKSIADLCRMSIREVHRFFFNLQLTQFETDISRQILQELKSRLTYLVDVGLDYLTLDRRTQTLSGGEFQRINLATAVGFKLMGSLYVLDEPSIGLHPRDNERLIKILKALRDLGNTVVVVEHDRDMMAVSDHLIDMGPNAGEHGGNVVFQGSFHTMTANGATGLTGDYLKQKRKIPLPEKRRLATGQLLRISNACENNLKNIDVSFPLRQLVVVTGVSGSGKSTLVHDTLYAGVAKHFGHWKKKVGKYDRIDGIYHLDDVVLVDQSPIGRTPRSNAVTYTKGFDEIRKLFAGTHSARIKGLTPGSFSFNTAGGRCPRCEGAGAEKVEMQFLADLYLECEVCGGKRFKKEILEATFRRKNIHDVLSMTVTEAMAFFSDQPRIVAKLKVLEDVGLGYLRLGQPATTLSGGEAQRVKLAAHLGLRAGKHQLYIFDEPTTGLHFHDISKLLDCFSKLLDAGNSIIVIEHNLDVIKCADYIVDLGPEGGNEGGRLVASGTPGEVMQNSDSHTASYLKRHLG